MVRGSSLLPYTSNTNEVFYSPAPPAKGVTRVRWLYQKCVCLGKNRQRKTMYIEEWSSAKCDQKAGRTTALQTYWYNSLPGSPCNHPLQRSNRFGEGETSSGHALRQYHCKPGGPSGPGGTPRASSINLQIPNGDSCYTIKYPELIELVSIDFEEVRADRQVKDRSPRKHLRDKERIVSLHQAAIWEDSHFIRMMPIFIHIRIVISHTSRNIRHISGESSSIEINPWRRWNCNFSVCFP